MLEENLFLCEIKTLVHAYLRERNLQLLALCVFHFFSLSLSSSLLINKTTWSFLLTRSRVKICESALCTCRRNFQPPPSLSLSSFPLTARAQLNYEPCTLINSFFEIFSSIKNWATFLRWSPWSWMISPSSESSTIVPLQLNFFLHSFKMIFLLILGLIPCNVVKDFLPFLCCVRMWMYLSWTESALIFSAFSFFFFLSSESSRSSWFNKSAWFANGSIPVVVFNCYAA